MAKLPTLYSDTWRRITEARPEFKHINLKQIWGREAKRYVDMDRVMLASLMKALNWRHTQAVTAKQRISGNGESYYNSVINNINADGLLAFYEFAIHAELPVAIIEIELTDSEMAYLASTNAAMQHAPAQWGTW